MDAIKQYLDDEAEVSSGYSDDEEEEEEMAPPAKRAKTTAMTLKQKFLTRAEDVPDSGGVIVSIPTCSDTGIKDVRQWLDNTDSSNYLSVGVINAPQGPSTFIRDQRVAFVDEFNWETLTLTTYAPCTGKLKKRISVMIKYDELIPVKKSKVRYVSIQTPYLSKLTKGKRPKWGETPKQFLARWGVTESYRFGGFILEPKKMPIYNDIYTILDTKLEILCAYCEKPAPGKTPCCYGRADYKVISVPKLYHGYEEIVAITYDIEAVSDMEAPHRFELLAYKINDGACVIVRSAAQFLDIVIAYVCAASKAAPTKKVLINLISFNGSRYDDLFLTPSWRKKIAYIDGNLDKYKYGRRKGAMIFNTWAYNNVTVNFLDVTRFTAGIVSLANVAKDLQVGLTKGVFPFQVLNDFKNGRTVNRADDGFFDKSYYKSDLERAESKTQYDEMMTRKPHLKNDIDYYCEEYCKRDVECTYLVYLKLMTMFKTYALEGLLEFVKFPTQKIQKRIVGLFEPATFHSLPTFASSIMKFMAATIACYQINSRTGEYSDPNGITAQDYYDETESEEAEDKKLYKNPLYAPLGDSYEFMKRAIYGGWVQTYYQGIILSAQLAEDKPFLADITSCPIKITKADDPLVMGDICSHYPTSTTGMMALCGGERVLDGDEQSLLVARMMSADKLRDIPLFFVRATMIPPRKPIYFYSTLPQRDENGSLRWTYSSEYGQIKSVYSSIQLWQAMKRFAPTRDNAWAIDTIYEMEYFPLTANCHASMIYMGRKLKDDGQKEGNKLKRTVGKILMNSCVGKNGQDAKRDESVWGEKNANAFFDVYQSKAALVEIGADDEYIFSLNDTNGNRALFPHAINMYDYSRYIRSDIIEQAMGDTAERDFDYCLTTNELRPETFPCPVYGDTDSFVMLKSQYDRIPDKRKGAIVGVYDPITDDFNYTLDLEDIFIDGFEFYFGAFLGKKTYLLITKRADTGELRMKFKCKGHITYDWARHPCENHAITRCELCKCPHSSDIYSCVYCIMNDEAFWNMTQPPPSEGIKGAVEPFVTSVSVKAFVRTVVLGQPLSVKYTRFDRALEKKVSKLGTFSVETVNRVVRLNRNNVTGVTGRNEWLFPDGDYLKNGI